MLTDTARGPEPWAVLTGDSLFVGDIARPDLAVDREEGARGVFGSLRSLLALPGSTEVWPGHLGGSLCGGPGMDMKVASTVAFERAHNELLRVEDEDAFVRSALASLGPQPPNFRAIVEINRGGETADRPDARPLTPRQVELKRAEGALLVDIRTDLQFDDAHVGGAIAITALRAGFGSKLAWLADREQEVVLIGRDDADAAPRRRPRRRRRHHPLRRLPRRRHDELARGPPPGRADRARRARRPARALGGGPRRRSRSSTSASATSGTPATSPARRSRRTTTCRACRASSTATAPIAVVCASGQRAAVGASLLQAHGAVEVWHVVEGGVPRWERQGWPTDRP